MLSIKIITRKGLIADKSVESVSFPTSHGEVEVLSDHSSSVFLLSKGLVKYGDDSYKIDEGIVKIYDNEVTVLC